MAETPSKEMREGDWICTSCNNHNFARKTVCNRCNGPKAPTGENAKPGDWLCPSCSNHNFSRRITCNKCNCPKPGAGIPAMGGLQSSVDFSDPLRAFGAMMAASLGIQIPGVPSAAPAAGGTPKNFKPGDWMCSSCSNHCFASRDSCNKCGSSKHAVATGGYGKVRTTPSAVPATPARFNPYVATAKATSSSPQANMKAGDWMCASCGNHNFARRDTCNKCSRPQNAPPNFRDGDWMCSSCGNHNFANKSNCNKCQAPKA